MRTRHSSTAVTITTCTIARSAAWPTARRARRLAAFGLFLPAAAAAQEATVRGTVRDSRAVPLPHAEVLVNDSLRARTDSAGRFTLGALEAGEIELTVRRVGFAPLSIPLALAPGRTRTLVVELSTLPYALDPVIVSASRPGIYGQVVDVRGEPIAGAEVLVAGADPVRSAADGGFAVTGLRPTSYLVMVRRDGHYAAHFSVTLPPDRGQEVRVELETLPESLTGGARRLASGFSPMIMGQRRDLDRRMRINRPLLIPRSALAGQGKRDIAEVLRYGALQVRPAAERGGAIPSPGARVPASAEEAFAMASAETSPLDRLRLSEGGGVCYFVDGDWPMDQVAPSTIPAAWIEMVEITRHDDTGTLRRRLPFGVPESACRLWVVLWLRY